MALFSVTNSTLPAGNAQQTQGTSYIALIAVAGGGLSSNYAQAGSRAGTAGRGRLYDILVGTNASPADNYVEYEVSRCTLGTTVTWLGSVASLSTAYTLDSADLGFYAQVIVNASQGSTANIVRLSDAWYVGVNQRASYRWVAAPGSEIVYPANASATGNNALALQARSGAFTGTCTGAVMVSEL
jgi:hypothetical protein